MERTADKQDKSPKGRETKRKGRKRQSLRAIGQQENPLYFKWWKEREKEERKDANVSNEGIEILEI